MPVMRDDGTHCDCSECTRIYGRDSIYINGRWIRREEVEMPRGREAESVRLEAEPRIRPEGAERSTTAEGELLFPFLPAGVRDKIGIVREMDASDAYYSLREYIVNRPFYTNTYTRHRNGLYDATLRCMLRREELAPGNSIGDIRTFSVHDASMEFYPVEDREWLYREYLGRTRPWYVEAVGVEARIVPDDEDKIKPRKVKGQLPRFMGTWAPIMATEKYKDCIFVKLSTRSPGNSTRPVEVDLILVDYQGIPVSSPYLMTLVGDLNGVLGHVSTYSGVDERLCPFELDGASSLIVGRRE